MTRENRTEFIRVEKNRNYTMIHNQFLRRKDLSWKAKGILAYILSLPDDWNINLKEVMRHATEGESAFRTGWKELKDAGYVKRQPVRDDKRIKYWETIVRESVDLEQSEQLGDFQHVDNQDVGFQDVDNRKLQSTYSTNNLNELSSSSTETTIREISQFYQENFGVLNPYTAEDLNWWVEDIGGELVLEALKKALEHGKTYSYAKGIMKNWVNKNIKTLDDVKAQDVAHKNNKRNSFKTVSDDTVDENFKETEEEELDVTFDDLMKGDQD